MTRAGLTILVSSLLLLVSCASTPKCPPNDPEIEIQKVYYPAPVLILIQPLPPLELPEVPPRPPADATEEEKKARAIEIGKAREEREAILLKRNEAWEYKIMEHNSQEVEIPNPGGDDDH